MTNNAFKPMLAAPFDGIHIQYPIILSPKLDGIRCVIIDGVACGRSLKPIPNKHVQNLFGKPEYNGLDGELIIGSPTARTAFNVTSAGVMSIEGTPNVKFYVFDDFTIDEIFARRLMSVSKRTHGNSKLLAVRHHKIEKSQDFIQWELDYVAVGYEGVMLRRPDGPYKYGRSTSKEGYLVKVKRFTDSEAIILQCAELMRNGNNATVNELGYLERPNYKDGKVKSGVLGSIVVRDMKTGIEFEIGTGFTASQRKNLWERRHLLVNQVVKYKSQPSGAKNKPRFPVFLGFRDIIDL